MTDETGRRSATPDRSNRHDSRVDRLDRLETRLDAVERAATGTEASVADLSDAAELDARLAEVEETLAEFDDRLSELDAAVQALRGYVGGIRTVNRAVERRADAALAAVESLERQRAETDTVAGIVEQVENAAERREASCPAESGDSRDASPDDCESSENAADELAARLRETW